MKELAAFVVAAILAAGAVGLWPAPEPEFVPGEPVVVRPSRACPEERPVIEETADLQQVLADKQEALAIATAQEELMSGKMLEWPDDPEEGVTEDFVEAELLAIAEEFGGHLIGLDCGEYPCVAMLAWTGMDFENKQAAHDAVGEQWPGARWGPDALFMPDGEVTGHAFSVVLAPDGEYSDDQKHRLRYRSEEAFEIFEPHEAVKDLRDQVDAP